jgi:hypothetical protein
MRTAALATPIGEGTGVGLIAPLPPFVLDDLQAHKR